MYNFSSYFKVWSVMKLGWLDLVSFVFILWQLVEFWACFFKICQKILSFLIVWGPIFSARIGIVRFKLSPIRSARTRTPDSNSNERWILAEIWIFWICCKPYLNFIGNGFRPNASYFIVDCDHRICLPLRCGRSKFPPDSWLLLQFVSLTLLGSRDLTPL